MYIQYLNKVSFKNLTSLGNFDSYPLWDGKTLRTKNVFLAANYLKGQMPEIFGLKFFLMESIAQAGPGYRS